VSESIIAAGAVVWRKSKEKYTEVVIIHRPKYNDWTFPKGKVEIGESNIAAAHREVAEETNLDTEFGVYLGEIDYFTPAGLKKVKYWSAKALTEKVFHPNNEVDELKWVPITKVINELTNDTDKEIFDRFVKVNFNTKPFILLRHAKAVSRDQWQGDDQDRPLDILGENQSHRLLSTYQVFNIKQIHTSDAVRCFSTVERMAKGLSIKLEVTGKLSEDTYRKDKEKAIEYAKDLIKGDENTLICSHNPILPKMLNKLTKKSDVEADEQKLLPAQAWVIHRKGKEIVQVDRIDAPTI
jgi:8-oxo-dGTP diphosphatase